MLCGLHPLASAPAKGRATHPAHILFCETRLHVFILTLIDTGCRSSEAMALRWSDVDFDNLLLKLHGKGAKDRLVPVSFELRRHLYRWRQLNKFDLVFAPQ